jgi:hypothetical protein
VTGVSERGGPYALKPHGRSDTNFELASVRRKSK